MKVKDKPSKVANTATVDICFEIAHTLNVSPERAANRGSFQLSANRQARECKEDIEDKRAN